MDIKLKDLVKIGVSVGDVFTGGAASKIKDIVQKSVDDKKDPLNQKAVTALAEMDEVQNQAIILHDGKLAELEKRVAALEKR